MNSLTKSARLVAPVIAAALVVVPAVDAKKKKPKPPQKVGVTYSGVTSQGSNTCRSQGQNDAPCSVFAKVSKSGTKVTQQVYFKATCEDGKTFRSSTLFKNVPLSKKGKYGVAGAHYTETLGDDGQASNVVTSHGQFKHKGTKYTDVGDYSLESDITFSDGTSTHCSTGKVTFTATYKKPATQG